MILFFRYFFTLVGDGYEDKIFSEVGGVFKAASDIWTGAKIGFFALRSGFINDAGSVDNDWFRIKQN